MGQNRLCLRASQGVVIGVVLATFYVCTMYSGKMNTTLTSALKDSSIIMQKSIKRKNSEIEINGNIDKCKLKWKNSKVNKTAYETLYDIAAIHRKNYLTLPKSVEPLYPDPAIRLNPDKFLLPIPYNGPNNQITGVREATFVAIKLNRTMVIPRFFKHFSDSSVEGHKTEYIFPGHRLDIEKYCRFISCVTIEQFQEACGRQLDAMVHLQRSKKSDIRQWESYSGMKFLSKVKNQHPGNDPENINVNVIPDFPIPGGGKFRKFKPDEIKTLLNSDARCVLYPKSLYNLNISESQDDNLNHVELVTNQKDIGRFTDYQLYLSISEASGSPEYIKNIAGNFVSSKLKSRPFVSVHWRFNKRDFMTRCRDSPKNDDFKRMLCKNVMRIKPGNIAQTIEKKISDLRRNHLNIKDIYIASPPSERSVVAGVAKLLYDKHGWLTFSSLDLDEFMKAKYDSCEILKLHFEDIVSTTEMEICGLGSAFLGSARSTWTNSVNLARSTSTDANIRPEFDGDIFMLSISTR